MSEGDAEDPGLGLAGYRPALARLSEKFYATGPVAVPKSFGTLVDWEAYAGELEDALAEAEKTIAFLEQWLQATVDEIARLDAAHRDVDPRIAAPASLTWPPLRGSPTIPSPVPASRAAASGGRPLRPRGGHTVNASIPACAPQPVGNPTRLDPVRLLQIMTTQLRRATAYHEPNDLPAYTLATTVSS